MKITLSPERGKRNFSNPASAWSQAALRSALRSSLARVFRTPHTRVFPAPRYSPKTGWGTGPKTLWMRLRLERKREWMTEVRERLSWRPSKEAPVNRRRNPPLRNLAAVGLMAIWRQTAVNPAARVSRSSVGSRSPWTFRRLRGDVNGDVLKKG